MLDAPVLLKDRHVYMDIDGNEYISITTFLKKFTPQFDFEGKSLAYALKNKIPVEDVRKEWRDKGKQATTFGTKIHEEIEYFFKSNTYKNEEFKGIVDNAHDLVHKGCREVKKEFLNEHVVFTKDLLIAGTSDLIVNYEDNTFDIVDFKTNKKIDFFSMFGKDQYCLDPISHIPNSKYFLYSLQLSFYGYLHSQITGAKFNRAIMYWFKRDDQSDTDNIKGEWVRYSLPYLKEEIESCLEYARQNKLG